MSIAVKRLANLKTRRETGLDYVVSAMNLLTPFGAKQIKEQKPFFPGQEDALERELDRVAEMLETAEANKKEMRAISDGISDLIVQSGHFDNYQKEKYAQFLAQKKQAEMPKTPAAAAPAAEENADSNASEAAAPVSEEAKTVTEKKKKVILKRKNRRTLPTGSGNLIPPGTKGNLKPKVSRKTENDLPSSIMPVSDGLPGNPAPSGVPSKPKNSAVPTL
jgi:hypothetical protein